MRKHERLLKKLRVRWKNETLQFEDVTLDICPGGLFIVSNRTLPPNTLLELEVPAGMDQCAQCRGQVAWVNHGQVTHYPQGFGVRFLDLPAEIVEHLSRCCSESEEEGS